MPVEPPTSPTVTTPSGEVTPGVPGPNFVPAGADPNGPGRRGTDAKGITLADIMANAGLGEEKAKPVDPTVAAGERTYFEIWGVKAPKGYIKGLVAKGLNAYEIAQFELSKPGARKTSFWRDKQATYASIAAQVFATRSG